VSDAEAESLTGRVNDCVARLATSDAAAVSVIDRGARVLLVVASDAERLSVAVRVSTTFADAESLARALSLTLWLPVVDGAALSETDAVSDAVRNNATFWLAASDARSESVAVRFSS
jgi:hypothetical protein